jgi:EAL domain-containing protein (putative c-di-GMP-specific phosphodiesterase class I)/GGDEF domain-containing protein
VRFATKLALFLSLTLVVIQVATGLAIYTLIRDTLVDEGKARLITAADRFIRQLNEIEGQVADGVKVLTLDFALRQAIAEHHEDTIVSALRNHGRRVGATRLMLVDIDGMISADSADAGIARRAGAEAAALKPTGFGFPDLLERAANEERVATIAIIDDVPVRLVVVPVLAPDPIAYVAAILPLDDTFLARMRLLAGLPDATGLVVGTQQGWQVAAGPIADLLVWQRAAGGVFVLGRPAIIETIGGETIFLATELAAARGGFEVAAIMGYPLSQALRPYHPLAAVLLAALATGLLAALLGAALIARGVSRPIEVLANYARRIGAGDYTVPPLLRRRDEVGELSTALIRMTRAIAEREDRIRYQASHEPVTGLPNRQALTLAMDGVLDSRPAGDQPAAVLVIALVRLQEISNTVGRDITDRVMCEAAARIGRMTAEAPMGEIRAGEAPVGATMLGCIGERSFAVLLPAHDAAASARQAARIIDALEQPYHQNDLTVDAGVGVGMALSPVHGTSAAILLRRAEVAQQVALTGNARLALYRAEADPHRPELLSLMSELRQGIQLGELELFYQPKLDLRTRRIIGVEALVRWNHPTRGLVLPDTFIGLAEETGNVQFLTHWALATGMAQAAEWRQQGLDLRVSINLSVRDLEDETFPDQVAAMLESNALPAEALVLEVTESAIMKKADATIAVLRRLADNGIALSIDDFGAGQSSLTYLRRLPVREVKIDKAFVLKLAQYPDDQAIVRAVVDLGHRLGYAVTAEGVEDAASLELLSSFGCDYAQGYLIAQPVPAARFSRIMQERSATVIGPQ